MSDESNVDAVPVEEPVAEEVKVEGEVAVEAASEEVVPESPAVEGEVAQ